MFDTSEHEYDKYCVLVEKYSKLLHPNHYQLQLCKRYLAGAIRGSLTLEMVEKRLSLMMDFISVFEKVDPGLTKWRGKMLYQVMVNNSNWATQNLNINIRKIISIVFFLTISKDHVDFL